MLLHMERFTPSQLCGPHAQYDFNIFPILGNSFFSCGPSLPSRQCVTLKAKQVHDLVILFFPKWLCASLRLYSARTVWPKSPVIVMCLSDRRFHCAAGNHGVVITQLIPSPFVVSSQMWAKQPTKLECCFLVSVPPLRLTVFVCLFLQYRYLSF